MEGKKPLKLRNFRVGAALKAFMHKTPHPHIALTQFQIYQKQQKCSNHPCNQSKNQKRCKTPFCPHFLASFGISGSLYQKGSFFGYTFVPVKSALLGERQAFASGSKTAMNLRKSILKNCRFVTQKAYIRHCPFFDYSVLGRKKHLLPSQCHRKSHSLLVCSLLSSFSL